MFSPVLRKGARKTEVSGGQVFSLNMLSEAAIRLCKEDSGQSCISVLPREKVDMSLFLSLGFIAEIGSN